MLKFSGYMSLEYAMEGKFSEKSDIFSFVVLLLEILSGRRNSSFYYDEQSVSLLGHVTHPSLIPLFFYYLQCLFLLSLMLRILVFFLCLQAWKLWKANNTGALIDPMISEPCYEMEILRCIHVGLLCVQEFAKDRPTVSTIISKDLKL